MDQIEWLLESEPWTRYRTLIDLLDRSPDEAQVLVARAEMLAHPQVQALVKTAATWGINPLKRHNDASHALYALSTLADFGLSAKDPGIPPILETVLAHQSGDGAFQSLLHIAPAYGGTGEDQWAWIACDAPTVLYVIIAMGLEGDECIQRAVMHLAELAGEGGFRCSAAPELGRFRGPGRRTDPCPIANVYALKALALLPAYRDSIAVHSAVEMLMRHWERQKDVKYYLFGVGTDFRKLKYPFVWYDILHVMDVLSLFPSLQSEHCFQEMLAALTSQADGDGRYTAGSMYQFWKGWSFADKKKPSPWLTFLVLRILKRLKNVGR